MSYKIAVNAIIRLQKRAIRIIYRTGYYEHANTLFIKSHFMKSDELIY